MTAAPADRFRRNAALFTETVEAVPDDAWDAPTPCAGWTVRDVVAHVVDTELDFLTQRGLAPDPIPPSDADPRVRWPPVRDAVQAVLDDPALAGQEYDGYFGRTSIGASLDRFYASDLTVHRWDVARGAGLTPLATIDDAEIAMLRDELGGIDEAIMRSPGLFDAPVAVADDASPTDRLVAWLGRDPR